MPPKPLPRSRPSTSLKTKNSSTNTGEYSCKSCRDLCQYTGLLPLLQDLASMATGGVGAASKDYQDRVGQVVPNLPIYVPVYMPTSHSQLFPNVSFPVNLNVGSQSPFAPSETQTLKDEGKSMASVPSTNLKDEPSSKNDEMAKDDESNEAEKPSEVVDLKMGGDFLTINPSNLDLSKAANELLQNKEQQKQIPLYFQGETSDHIATTDSGVSKISLSQQRLLEQFLPSVASKEVLSAQLKSSIDACQQQQTEKPSEKSATHAPLASKIPKADSLKQPQRGIKGDEAALMMLSFLARSQDSKRDEGLTSLISQIAGKRLSADLKAATTSSPVQRPKAVDSTSKPSSPCSSLKTYRQ